MTLQIDDCADEGQVLFEVWRHEGEDHMGLTFSTVESGD